MNNENEWKKNKNIVSTPNQYKIVKEIGRGGKGVVYSAIEEKLGRNIAIKKISSAKIGTEEKEKFAAEAWVHAFLEHPNIAPVYELGRTIEGNIFLAMKHVKGKVWSELLKQNKKESQGKYHEEKCIRHFQIWQDMATAVAFAHSKKIVHNDLKPDNVMVGEFDEILLMDWGMAVDIGSQPLPALSRKKVKEGACTALYAPPELINGKGNLIGPWTDVYLLGSILYQIITHEPLHKGKTSDQTLVNAYKGVRPSFPQNVAEELQIICRKALMRDSRERYSSVRELKKDLNDYLDSRHSIRISQQGLQHLNAFAKEKKYSILNLSLEEFSAALKIDACNIEALFGKMQSHYQYAKNALEKNDFTLAKEQIAMSYRSSQKISDSDLSKQLKLQKQRHEIETKTRTDLKALRSEINDKLYLDSKEKQLKKLYLRWLKIAGIMFAIGLMIGIFLINAEKNRTQREKLKVEQEKLKVETAKDQREQALLISSRRLEEAQQKLIVSYNKDCANSLENKNYLEAAATVERARSTYLQAEASENILFRKLLETMQYSIALHIPKLQQSISLPQSEHCDVSPDGKLLVAKFNKRLICWKTDDLAILGENSRPVMTLPWQQPMIFDIGNKNLVVATTNEIKIYNLLSGKIYKSIHNQKSLPLDIQFLPQEKAVACKFYYSLMVFTTTNKKYQLPLASTSNFHQLAISPDASLIASGSKEGIEIWNWRKQKQHSKISHTHATVTALAFHPQKKIICYGSKEGTLFVHDFNQNTSITLFGHDDRVTSIKWHPQGFWASISVDGRLLFRNGDNHKKFHSLTLSKNIPYSLRFFGNDIFVTGSGKNLCRRWTMEPRQFKWLTPAAKIKEIIDPLNNTSFSSADLIKRPIIISPHNKFIVTAYLSMAQLWNIENNTQQAILPRILGAGTIQTVVFSSDEKKLAIFYRDLQLSVYATKDLSLLYSTKISSNQAAKVTLLFSKDNRYIICNSKGHTLLFCDMINNKKWSLQQNLAITSLGISPDGKLLACSGSGLVIATMKKLANKQIENQRLPTALHIKKMAWHSNSKLLAVHDFYQVEIWQLQSNGEWYKKYTLKSQEKICNLSFSPCGDYLALFSANKIAVHNLKHNYSLPMFSNFFQNKVAAFSSKWEFAAHPLVNGQIVLTRLGMWKK